MAIKRVGVIGSGIMGAGIVECTACAGFEVVLRSREHATAEATLAGIEKAFARQVDKGKLSEEDSAAALARITPTGELGDLSECDLVLESIVEDLASKKHLFRELDRVCQPGAILATNTSTLPVVEMAMETNRPDRVCGIHFFNPAPIMSLIELVRPLTASAETLAEARTFAESCGKNVVEVKDQAGFIVNHLLFPYLNNAVRLLEAGVATRDDIDAAMRGGCAYPMGPLAVLDLVGIDTSVAILDALYDEFRDHHYSAVPMLRRMVSAGLLGRKSGKGFYDYHR